MRIGHPWFGLDQAADDGTATIGRGSDCYSQLYTLSTTETSSCITATTLNAAAISFVTSAVAATLTTVYIASATRALATASAPTATNAAAAATTILATTAFLSTTDPIPLEQPLRELPGRPVKSHACPVGSATVVPPPAKWAYMLGRQRKRLLRQCGRRHDVRSQLVSRLAWPTWLVGPD